MTTLLTPYIPFAPISWWFAACNADSICFDGAEPFRKMTLRSRYYIAGANGIIRLSIPILNGREQRIPMKDIRISQQERWQTQHWRTILSAYRRAPFFEFYEPELYPLFNRSFNWLIDFNQETFRWFQERLSLSAAIISIADTHFAGNEAEVTDFRYVPSRIPDNFPVYHQVFAERTGFIPDLSLLDLLFAEGPGTLTWLKQHPYTIL